MNYLIKKYEYFSSEIDKKKFIESIIDEEANKSKEFGLEISEEDLKMEKIFFVNIFEFYWDHIVDCRSNSEYNQLMNKVSNYLSKNLSILTKKYFDLSKEKSIKNNYNCHTSCCIYSLFSKINNKLF